MSLIPAEILQRPARMLYMTPLALGDFLYQSGFLREVRRAYPRLTIDIWFDDLRKRSKSWHQGRNRTLGQWLDEVEFIDRVYPIPADGETRAAATADARAAGYDLVLYLCKSRIARYEKYARRICPQGFVAGVAASKERLARLFNGARPDLLLPMEEFDLSGGAHVSEFYGHFFGKLFDIDAARVTPTLEVPQVWRERIAAQFGPLRRSGEKLILINSLSTNRSHDLPLEDVFALTRQMLDRDPALRFILCAPPHALADFEDACSRAGDDLVDRLIPFTAREHFFELPALVEHCDAIMSVDTSVVHFASALERPLVALMRSNNRQWRPLEGETTRVVYAEGKSWVKDIPPEEILGACARQGFFRC